VRVVTDSEGETWICLELPTNGTEPAGKARVECNTGKDRVEVLLPANWMDLPDPELAGVIRGSLKG
jgi:hypothetical protein